MTIILNSQNVSDAQLGSRPMVRELRSGARAEFAQALRANGSADWRNYFGYVTNNAGEVIFDTPRNRRFVANNQIDLATHSLLRKDEWEELDAAIIEAVMLELNLVSELRALGLVQTLGGLGTMLSQWNVAAEKVQPSVTMSGRAVAEQDRVEKILRAVPVPIIRQDYTIGIRELLASRNTGDSLDTTEAAASGAAVGEHIERMTYDGESSIVLGGNSILGITNQTGIDTDTAASYGGGDWGTITNVVPTVIGMMSALAAKRYRGPFILRVANTQYFQAMESFANKQGSPLSELQALPQIQSVGRSDFLPAGEVVLIQATRNVIDLAIALETTNREWSSNDGMEFSGAVMASITPRVKRDHSGNVGVALATSA